MNKPLLKSVFVNLQAKDKHWVGFYLLTPVLLVYKTQLLCDSGFCEQFTLFDDVFYDMLIEGLDAWTTT